MAKLERGNHFLSGFGNENFIEEYYMDRGTGLKPSSFLSENEDIYKLEVGIPFMKEHDIDLSLLGNQLTISGVKSTHDIVNDVSKRKYIGVLYIPVDVKMNEIYAHFEDGLLTITLPKKEMERVAHSISLK